MRYMIHACPQRMWYVEGFLIPSMEAQGIERRNITVWNDSEGRGNLYAFAESMRLCGALNGGVWHMQDDVLICGDFAARTAREPEWIACGFGCAAFDPEIACRGPNIPVKFMWYSFQCIYIPNELAGAFARWFYDEARHREAYREKLADRKHDDWFFRRFMLETRPEARVENLDPCLVDHVDYLIGGTIVNPRRSRKINRAAYWPEPERNDELARLLREQNR